MPARTFRDILAELAARSDSTRDKGTRFELLTQAFFQTDALYTSLFTNVWRWSEWPGSQGRSEIGIDLVAQNADDEKYTAIQCKFYAPQNTIAKPDIDSFLSASGTTEFTKRIIVSTTEKWNRNAEETIEDQQIPVSRIGVPDFEKSSINWDTFDLDTPADMTRVQRKRPREDQLEALDAVLDGFKQHARGKLIMACGTGKTYTALRIAEEQVRPGGIILFLAPSITLVSQSVREWGNDASVSLRIHAVCSDPKAGQRQKSNDEDTNEIAPYDLVSPATTAADTLVANVRNSRTDRNRTVIFSTYQSLDVIIAAQALGLGRIDLIICDEAHRTTGVTLVEGAESEFTKVHHDRHIAADKRLYMTATPRIFDERSRTKAGEVNATLASMDDESIYGPEFYRLSFADAVEKDLLCDYRVLIFGINEATVARNVQGMLAGDDNSLTLNDAAKIVASWNAISKQQSAYEDFGDDPAPMRRVVAFANRIKQSEQFTATFNGTVQEYAENSRGGYPDIKCVSEHVDGRQNALVRGNKLEWLRGDGNGNECHILSNARCLTEGVDVPALDAVLFLSPRSSQIDVVQAVGRAMRQAPGTDKKYGYIIIPIAVTPEGDYLKTIRDSRYNATWQVLQALKSHDEDFYDTINQADLKQNKKISVVIFDDTPGPKAVPREETPPYSADVQIPLPTDAAEEIREAVYARIVDSLTDKHYYRRWAEEVERINRQYETRIRELLAADDPPLQAAFAAFLGSLQRDLNDGITRDHAISMLAQHLITKPVFDALFAEYEFTRENPVSQAMERMTRRLELDYGTGAETKELAGFYKSVQRRIHYVEKAEDKQRIIADLYEDFFKLAIPKTAASLGIVYTPVEAVDFILRSVEDILQEEFGKSLTDAGIHVLDPFTGTGTFIQRLLASGLIKPHDLARKYTQELHANEMVLLAYYIAAINIETTYHDRAKATAYTPFEGIVLTDTFESREYHQTPHLSADFTPSNNARLEHQKQQDIRVIVGNPPWSVGQRSENDDNKNRVYERLRQRISETYARKSTAKLQRNLYDTYIQGIRWASDRIHDSKHGGIVAFITNGGFIASDSADGLRKTLTREFDTIYCLNLRGDQRTAGEKSRQEGGKLFGSGSRAAVAILILVKKPGPVIAAQAAIQPPGPRHSRESGNLAPPATIYYHEVADYQTREDKLALLAANRKQTIPWQTVTPDKYGDWINQRSDDFQALTPLYGDGGIFNLNSPGILTARDAWCYNFSKPKISGNTKAMMDFFTE